MISDIAKRYVANGAGVLDDRGPEGWRETLRNERMLLDVYSMNDCPLGILYGSYSAGRDRLWPELGNPQRTENVELVSKHGFDYGLEVSASELTAAWLELLDADVLV